MSINLLSDTIEMWALRVLEYEVENKQGRAEQARNWLFGAGLALQILDDEDLIGLSQRALEASENERISNRTVGADPGSNVGDSGVESQRPDLARATRCPRTAGADGGAGQ